MTMNAAVNATQITDSVNRFTIPSQLQILLKGFLVILVATAIFLTSCCKNSCEFEPNILGYTLPTRAVEQLQSPFKRLSKAESNTDWGKELRLGKAFAREMDLYRALTCFKRARILIPKSNQERLTEIDYDIFLAYYLGNKYEEAIDAFETSSLMNTSIETFPALHDLYVALYDAYIQTGRMEKATSLFQFIECSEPYTAQYLVLETSVNDGNIPGILEAASCTPLEDNTSFFVTDFCCHKKSPQTARILNGILPGAGYLYVGQKRTALTSFLINALFIAATYQFFDRGYIAAGAITASLEAGWYFGGINGAGLAANEYNQRIYECSARDFLIDNRLFPVLMITMGF